MRYFLGSIIIHVLMISFVWIGFSVSRGKEQNSFTYLGEMVSGTEQYSHTNSSLKASDVAAFEEVSPALFAPWLKMRELNKPR